MSNQNEQQYVNPYDVNYTMPEYYVKYNQESLPQPPYQPTPPNVSNSNVNEQPLISYDDSLDYTESFSNVTPRVTGNEANQRQISWWVKCCCITEFIFDVIAFLVYLILLFS